MTKWGKEAYERGLQKRSIDRGYAKNPNVLRDLKKELDKNKKARDNFENFCSILQTNCNILDT